MDLITVGVQDLSEHLDKTTKPLLLSGLAVSKTCSVFRVRCVRCCFAVGSVASVASVGSLAPRHLQRMEAKRSERVTQRGDERCVREHATRA